jgi:hypothetical protein
VISVRCSGSRWARGATWRGESRATVALGLRRFGVNGVADVFRFPDPPPPPPKNRLVATLFQMASPGGRTLTCAAYEVETGLELRVSYGDNLMRSELFRGLDRDERLAETADSWHLALLERGLWNTPDDGWCYFRAAR